MMDKKLFGFRKNVGEHILGMVVTISIFLLLASGASAAEYAYVANAGSNNVSVIDTATNTIVDSVNVGLRPEGIAVNLAGTRVYVTNTLSNNVSVIDTSTNAVIDSVNVGYNPYEIVVNSAGTRAYVANIFNGTVSVIDTTTNTFITSVNVGGPLGGVAVNPTGTRVYVINAGNYFGDGEISVIDTATNTVINSVKLDSPVGTAVDQIAVDSAGIIYFTNGGNLSVIYNIDDYYSGVGLGGFPIHNIGHWIVVNPAGTKVYVTGYRSGNVSVVAIEPYTVPRFITLVNVSKDIQGIAVNHEGTRVYVSNFLDDNISVIDTTTNTVVDSVNVGDRPYGIAIVTGDHIHTATPTPTVTPTPAILPPPVNQNFGIYDTMMINYTETLCRNCHTTGVADRHNSTGYNCDYCHPIISGSPLIERNCMMCHNGSAFYANPNLKTGRPHHNTTQAQARNCKFCHSASVDDYNDGHYIPSYPESELTPSALFNPNGVNFTSMRVWGGCLACHAENIAANPQIFFTQTVSFPPIENGNNNIHHIEIIGITTAVTVPGDNQCYWCHSSINNDIMNIRGCEMCHSVSTIHNIQKNYTDTNGKAGYGHIGDNWDCKGCHASGDGGSVGNHGEDCKGCHLKDGPNGHYIIIPGSATPTPTATPIPTVTPINQPPTASFTYSPNNPLTGDQISFDATSSYDNDGKVVLYEWDWDNDGKYDESSNFPTSIFWFTSPGTYTVNLRVTDDSGNTNVLSKQVTISDSYNSRSNIVLASMLGDFYNTWNPWSQNHKDFVKIDEWLREKPSDKCYKDLQYYHCWLVPSGSKQLDWLRGSNYGYADEAFLINVLNKEIDHGKTPGLTYKNYAFSAIREEDTVQQAFRVGMSSYDPGIRIAIGYFIPSLPGVALDYTTQIIGSLLPTQPELTGIYTVLNGVEIVNTVNGYKELVSQIKDKTYVQTLGIYFGFADSCGYGSDINNQCLDNEFNQINKSLNLPKTYGGDMTLEETKTYWNKLWHKYGSEGCINGGGGINCKDWSELNSGLFDKTRADTRDQVKKVIISALDAHKTELNIESSKLLSPGELRVYDSKGNVTGLVNGEIKEEIPYSLYDKESKTVEIFSKSGQSYEYEVKGTGTGVYGLYIDSLRNGTDNNFSADGIPTTPGQDHQYIVDWSLLSTGGKGVTLNVDSNGDGTFENTIISGNTLTRQGGAGISVYPRTSNITNGQPNITNIKVKNTQNLPDTFRVYINVSEIPLQYRANLSWFNWTEQNIYIGPGEEKIIPIKIIPTVTGTKMFRAKVNSTTANVYAFDTGSLKIN